MHSFDMDCDLRELAECTICMNTFFDARILNCGQVLAFDCWRTINSSTFGVLCPECRTKSSLTAVQLTQKLSLEALIRELISTNTTHVTYSTRLPMCRGCCKRYPPRELKGCKGHDAILCNMCATSIHRHCSIMSLNEFVTVKLQELSKEIVRKEHEFYILRYDHVVPMQKILDSLSKFQSDLKVQEDCLCIEGNTFQPLINQFCNILTVFTEIQAEFPTIAPEKCSITELENLKAELDALQIKYPKCNPVKQKLECINNLHAKLTEMSRAAQEKYYDCFLIFGFLKNVLETGQNCPKRAFILLVSAAELFGISVHMQELDDNLRTIRYYANTFHNLWSEYVETEPYFAPIENTTMKVLRKIDEKAIIYGMFSYRLPVLLSLLSILLALMCYYYV